MTTITMKKAAKSVQTKSEPKTPAKILKSTEKPRVKIVKASPTPLGVDSRLFQMLSVKRPHQSQAEKEWVEKYIMPYKPHVFAGYEAEAYFIQVGEGSRTLFSAHVDTVHRSEGLQALCYDPIKNHIFKDDGEPLGADDASGVWLLLEMIDAGIPGGYLLTRGEEKGGIGARAVATYEKKFLAQFDRAIAFDRKATDSIISHQSGGRCCSDAFAEALAGALNDAEPNFMYSPDDTGVYTDTAEYTDIIPECTNVSVGYYSEHTQNEMQDLDHLLRLRAACLAIDWEALPVKRDPLAYEPSLWATYSTGGGLLDKKSGKKSGKDQLEFDADEWMTRAEMIDQALADPEGFVSDLRYYFYGDDESTSDYDKQNYLDSDERMNH